VTPLRVTATLSGPVSVPEGYVHLDALLAYAVALREQLPPARTEDEMVPIEIPVEREPGGRFHLASAAVADYEVMELRHTHRRFPVAEAQGMGTPKLRRINLSAGPQKNFRIPMETGHLYEDRLEWVCTGDRGAVLDLLYLVSHIGRKRSAGLGRVVRWNVEECEAWAGFPVLAEGGAALRHLPIDWPELGDHEQRYGCLTYPYWLQSRETLIAAPLVGV